MNENVNIPAEIQDINIHPLQWRHDGLDSVSIKSPASPLFTQPFIRAQENIHLMTSSWSEVGLHW